MTGALPLAHGAAIVWAVWYAGWVFAARAWFRTQVRQETRVVAHAPLLSVGPLVTFWSRHLWLLAKPLWPVSRWVAWLGLALTIVGLGSTLWSRAHLGRFWTADLTIMQGHTLVRTGPYSMTRHPIYAGLVAAMLGTALAWGTLGAAVGLAIFVTAILLRVTQEERILVRYFGDEYVAYRRDIPAFLPRRFPTSRPQTEQRDTSANASIGGSFATRKVD